jgi:ubiquinone biosynthesis protein COQ4
MTICQLSIGPLPGEFKRMSLTTTYTPESAAAQPASLKEKPFRIRPLKALRALGILLKNKEDTVQVFEIMRALSGRSIPNGYARLLDAPNGGAIAYRRRELAEILSDRAFLERLPEGSVGRAYLNFTTSENISAQGLIEESRKAIEDEIDLEHPYTWYGRRLRDVHDLWHVLTGYGRDALGEASLVAFSYAQTKSHGFGLIGFAGALKLRQESPRQPMMRAVWEGYRNGAKAAWLPGEDYVRLLSEPLAAARVRLKINPPVVYETVPPTSRNGSGGMMGAA